MALVKGTVMPGKSWFCTSEPGILSFFCGVACCSVALRISCFLQANLGSLRGLNRTTFSFFFLCCESLHSLPRASALLLGGLSLQNRRSNSLG